jgi:hypothetical protein
VRQVEYSLPIRPVESLKRGVRLRPEQQGCKDHGYSEEGKSYDENCHCSDPLQPPSPSGAPPPGAAAIRPLLLESPLEPSGAHVIPPTGLRAHLLPVSILPPDRGSAHGSAASAANDGRQPRTAEGKKKAGVK